jgi:hypothetical protein
MNILDCRSAFQSWYQEEMHDSDFNVDNTGAYLDDYVEYAWQGFKAASVLEDF